MSRTHSTRGITRRRTRLLAGALLAMAIALALTAPPTGSPLAWGAGVAGSAGAVTTTRADRSADPISDPDSFVRSLQKRGFEVGQGGFKLWGVDECPATYALMGSCYFNNPTAPYVVPTVPYWPDEFVDPATRGAFGEVPSGSGVVHRLDPNEALVIYGDLPPQAAYFGIQSYQFTHQGTYSTDNPTYDYLSGLNATSIFFHQVPQNTARISTFSSLSNAVNNVVIDRQSGSTWNQPRFFVITPDRFMDKQVRQVLHTMGVDGQDVFSEHIPSNMQLGLGSSADEFMTAVRYANPADGGGAGTGSAAWRQNPSLHVLRIRDTRPDRPNQPYPAWVDTSPEVRGGVSEAYLQTDLTNLVYQVSQHWSQPCATTDCTGRAAPFIDTQSSPFNLVGPRCDTIGMDCLGDTQDASYQFRPGLRFDNGEVYAVVGTLGTHTGNATYVSLGVNNTQLRLGAKNVDGAQLVGSADGYAVGHADQLYVHYFTRDCTAVAALTGGNCTSVENDPLVIPTGVSASLVQRDYMAVGTQRGPNSTLTLPATVLRLQLPTS
ncbi:hypothetical protein [Raineyella fluvialis]|uniref:Uncharacterized protein n=1 Tax=Raineyella fluvialis TaxID=2662261 RepID=A0A5Q2FB15_9ACTN|nr:hypothetical protein [Raineyella fluvialis]QGF22584.1 hypothetical protein Rai3103_01570 [Raineyella fluvialis]